MSNEKAPPQKPRPDQGIVRKDSQIPPRPMRKIKEGGQTVRNSLPPPPPPPRKNK